MQVSLWHLGELIFVIKSDFVENLLKLKSFRVRKRKIFDWVLQVCVCAYQIVSEIFHAKEAICIYTAQQFIH